MWDLKFNVWLSPYNTTSVYIKYKKLYTRIGKAVNDVRKRRGLPLIKVKGTYTHVCTSE